MTRDNIAADRSTRPLAVAGILVGAVALLGFDLTNPTTAARWHKTPSSIVHSVAPSNAAMAVSPALACSAVVLAILLWLGRQSVNPLRWITPIEPIKLVFHSQIPPALRSRASISYHSGGLYGP
jgi:hypothetical protein